MKKNIILLCLFLCIVSCTQKPVINRIDLEKSDSFKGSPNDPFRYPVIKTGDEEIDSLINHDFKNRMTDNRFKNESVEAAMQDWSENGIGYLDYEVSFNENDLLSFHVTSEFFGSYLTRSTSYFNYDISTGMPLQLKDVLKMSSPFTTRLKKDKNELFAKAKIEIQIQNLIKTQNSIYAQNAGSCPHFFHANQHPQKGKTPEVVTCC